MLHCHGEESGKVSNPIFCYNAGLQNGEDYFYGKINQSVYSPVRQVLCFLYMSTGNKNTFLSPNYFAIKLCKKQLLVLTPEGRKGNSQTQKISCFLHQIPPNHLQSYNIDSIFHHLEMDPASTDIIFKFHWFQPKEALKRSVLF